MRKTLFFFAAAALATAASAASLPWKRMASPDKSFSVETPCTADEVEGFSKAPETISGGISLKRESRVLCLQDGLLLSASVVDIDDTTPGMSAFDSLVKAVDEDTSSKTKPKEVMIDGRRALLNRESADGFTAQTGFIDLGGAKMIMLIAGFQPPSKASPAEQAQTIDRFTNSLKVASK